MGNRCTIDIYHEDLLERCANELGSLQPKKVTVWEAIVVDIFLPVWMESSGALSIYAGEEVSLRTSL